MGTEGETSGKRRRKHSPPVVASVAAAVLLAGGGGAYWAATAGGGSPGPAADGRAVPPPPLALDDEGSTGSSGPPPGIAVGEPDPNGGGTRYRAEGKLPDGPARAPVYTAGREPGASDVAALARALGVGGEPRKADGVWTVGRGADPTIQVGVAAPGDWTYALHGIAGGKPCVHPPGAGPEKDGPGKPDDAPVCPSFRDRPGGSDPAAARPVSEERARAAARPVLEALGLRDAKVDASKVFGAVRTVTADPVLGGHPTYGRQTVLRVGADGRVADGAGALVSPVKGAEYPLVSAARALDELNRRAGKGGGVRIGGCATPVPADEGAGSAPGSAGPGTASPPCAGGTLPRASVPIRGARFALAARSVAGRPALVPSWLFEAAVPGGGKATVTVVEPAVDPEFLTTARSGRPLPGKGEGRAVPAQVTSYSADGSRLTLRFWGGVCSDYAASAQAQSAAAVTVKVTGVEREPGRPCVLAARRFDRKVALDRPLGGRKVVDVATGEPVPRG
ncbi:hypothetical protein ACSNOK_30370 [Streptomyces sp. URMC 126]|uniref:hypothetical protein n=1 Tax=Streptomyces sp. URMC 126 TaxID=3423401 RepID=UPI003F1A19E2